MRNRGGLAKYLYDLPWYVLIGPPGIRQIDGACQFGIEVSVDRRRCASRGRGRRRRTQLRWWFASDAVFLETAGRHTTQDLNAKPNQNSWAAFLDLLNRNRPRQPINGVLVAFSLEDLLTLPPAEVAAQRPPSRRSSSNCASG